MYQKLIESLEKLTGKKVVLKESSDKEEELRKLVSFHRKEATKDVTKAQKMHSYHLNMAKKYDKQWDDLVLAREKEEEKSKKVLKEGTDVESELQRLFNELVPRSGKAETEEGEMVRAINRIWYRYENDGDFFFKGYGKETCASSVNYLLKCPVGKEIKPIIQNMMVETRAKLKMSRKQYDFAGMFQLGDPYLKGLKQIGKLVVDYVTSKQGEHSPVSSDSRMTEGKLIKENYGQQLDYLQKAFDKVKELMRGSSAGNPKQIWVDFGVRNQICDENGNLIGTIEGPVSGTSTRNGAARDY